MARTALAPALWGGTYALFTETLPTSHPLSVAAGRSLVGGLLLLAWVRSRRTALGRAPSTALAAPRSADLAARWSPDRALARLVTLALLNVGFFSALLFLAAARLPGGTAAILTSTQPLVAAFAAWPLLGLRPGRAALGAGLLGVLGVALLVAAPGAALDPLGVGAALGAAGAMGVGTVLVRRWRGLGPALALAAWQLVLGGLALAPLAFALEGAPPSPTATQLAGFALLATVGTAWTFGLWIRGAAALGPGAAFLGLLSPLVATGLGALLLGERLGALEALGALLVLAAAGAGAVGGGSPSATTSASTPPAPATPAPARPDGRRSRAPARRTERGTPRSAHAAWTAEVERQHGTRNAERGTHPDRREGSPPSTSRSPTTPAPPRTTPAPPRTTPPHREGEPS
ncbi:MAG TPA: DMT family transporter [Polyangiaceae bacterium LLY-WYZ-15_(1-7)]|nr:DMT family transporter [Polyangiaceae bacterium LLY-WYZ-15_(1-7)]HJL08471.1 DMT family transporter [Polyangiaceae bacterium LLY-WYZ-15_(1-7)]HJL34295.1 DMT family transporter [Polyangiaceae bacterium LLY-WYZ-15_(1-7)]